MAYEGKGSKTNLSSGHMEDSKIKVDYGEFIHVSGKQKLQTVYELPHGILHSDQDWDPGTLSVGHDHPSTWPENMPTKAGDDYMDKTFNVHCNSLQQHVPQAICSSFSNYGSLLDQDDLITAIKNHVSVHGYLHYHGHEDNIVKSLLVSFVGYDQFIIAIVISMMPCGFQEIWLLVKPYI